jgi:hypothetical protein
MSFSNWLSSFKYRSLLCGNARVRRDKSRPRISPKLMQLEDRCLPSVFTPVLPKDGTEQSSGLNAVVYTPEGDNSFNKANLPAAKLVTVMNNSSNVVFPIFYGANSTVDGTTGTVVRLSLDSPGLGYGANTPSTTNTTVTIEDLSNPGNKTATAKVQVAGDGSLYGLELVDGGAGYGANDKLDVIFKSNVTPTKDAMATAYVSQYNNTFALYDPRDPLNITYRGYIGEFNPVTKNNDLGLQPGHQVTVMVPIALWDGGRLYFATNGSVPLTSTNDPGYPLQPSSEWTYNPTTDLNVIQSYVVAPSKPGDMPLYGADFADPVTGDANPNGVVMWYRDASGPHDFGHSVPAALTEMTFRDTKQPFIAPDMPPREVDTIINYDVSYVDSLALPASMEGTKVPLATTPSTNGNFTWLGSDMSIPQMQQLIANFTMNDTTGGKPGVPGVNGLGTYFGGLGYDQFYLPPDNSPSGAITSINNGGGPITITVPNTGGLVSGATVTISGVTDQTTGLPAAINGNWQINNLTLNTFQLMNSDGNTHKLTGGNYLVPNTGIHIEKVPAGFQVIADSANNDVGSPYNANKYFLASGGTKAIITTNGTGVSTDTSTDITGVSYATAVQLAPGMLWSAVNAPNGKPFFPTGTTIASIQIGTVNGSDSIIHMSAPAQFTGSPGGTNGQTGPGGTWTFSGSQFTSATGSIVAGTLNQITGIDPAVGIYLRPGMLVTGGGIPTPTNTIKQTFIQSISPDFKTITLTQSGTASPSGAYTFLGSGSSYIVQKLIDVWYAWADYYVKNSTPPSPSVTASVYGPNNPAVTPKGTNYADPRQDPNALLLTGLTTAFTSTLQIGDVVTGPGLTDNPTGSPGTPGYDPSLNYTVSKIYDTSVELSLPTTKAVTNGSYSFKPPQYVVRSSDAPSAPGTAGKVPYTLNFADAQKQSAMLFASQVYDVMQSFSLLVDPTTLLSRSARLIQYCIGGNVGSFIANDKLFFGQTGRHTSLPHDRTHVELRDEIKSILRGVYDFNKVPDQSQWYPAPATPTPGATLDTSIAQNNPQPITFGIQNLNPYVWFVHTVLHNSSYGFSLDDDVANTTAKTNSIEVAFGGNAYTPQVTTKNPPAPNLSNLEAFTPGVPYGTQHSQGFIDVSSSYAKEFMKPSKTAPYGMTTISGLSDAAAAALVASTLPTNPPGGLITCDDFPDLLPAGVRVALVHVATHVIGDDVSYVTFLTPKGWTAPEEQTEHNFTFNSFTTNLPTNVTPTVSQAAPGTVIAINGKGFTGVFGISFNGIPGTLIGGAITGITNPNAGTITIGTSNTEGLANGDTVTISGVTGQTAINGSWVIKPNSIVANTSFQIMGITGNGDTSSGGNWIDGTKSAVKVIVPSFTPNTGNTTFPGPVGKIAVRNASGSGYSSTFFTIGATSGPTFTGIDKSGGSLDTTVTLSGTGFTGTSAVTFNGGSGTPINSFTPNASGTQLQLTIPIGATGTGSFTVTTSGGTSTSTGITFSVNAPTIAATNPFSPASGSIGTLVTITGTGFTGADQTGVGGVTINGTPATNVQLVSDTQIMAKVGPGTATGSGPVKVTTSAGSVTSTATFTVTVYPTPNITSATPNKAAVGALIQLQGTGFTGADQTGGGVFFNGTAATTFTVVNDTTITVIVPLGATNGPIVVKNPTNSSNSVAFMVTAPTPPTIEQFSPGAGKVNDPVTLTGSGFTNVTDVEFNGTQAFFSTVNDATITAYVPNGATRGPITATNGLGTGTSATDFVVATQPTITSFSPDTGPAGTPVTLTGTGFTSVIQVSFNGTAATFKVNSDTSLTATVPAGATSGTITVSTGGDAASSAKPFIITARITTPDASLLTAAHGFVVAKFNGLEGVWLHDSTGWQQLTPVNPSLLATNGVIVAGEFRGYGVWEWTSANSWQQLTPDDASQLVVDPAGNVVGDFLGYGVQQWLTGTTWQQLTKADASLLAADANGNVVGEFMGYGVWKLKSPNMWQQLTMDNASILALDDNNNALGQFMGSGILINANFVLNGWVPLAPF